MKEEKAFSILSKLDLFEIYDEKNGVYRFIFILKLNMINREKKLFNKIFLLITKEYKITSIIVFVYFQLIVNETLKLFFC